MSLARRRLIGLAALTCAAMAVPPAVRAATTWKVIATGSDMDAKFTPAALTVQVGDTVQWVNTNGTHNVVSDDGLFTSGFVQPPDGPAWPFNYTFTATGSYRYYCSIHGGPGGTGQSGIIFVRPAHAANEIVYEAQAWDFQPISSTVTTDYGPESAMRHVTGGTPAQLIAGVRLPSGAKIAGIEITGCDDSDGADLTAFLAECPDPDGACTALVTAASTGKPGCDFFAASLADGPSVNNLANTYFLSVLLGPDSALRFRNVRVFYRRVVSPAPLTATFGDVPTSHQFFRAIEALYASGITQGCGNGNFCPNDPVTRATLASFLARALGLSFPN